jgi:hypothetical protein
MFAIARTAKVDPNHTTTKIGGIFSLSLFHARKAKNMHSTRVFGEN